MCDGFEKCNFGFHFVSYKHHQAQTRRHCECLYSICIATGDLFMYMLRTGYDESLFSIGFKWTVSQKIYKYINWYMNWLGFSVDSRHFVDKSACENDVMSISDSIQDIVTILYTIVMPDQINFITIIQYLIRIWFYSNAWHFGSFYSLANERNEQIDTDIKSEKGRYELAVDLNHRFFIYHVSLCIKINSKFIFCVLRVLLYIVIA